VLGAASSPVVEASDAAPLAYPATYTLRISTDRVKSAEVPTNVKEVVARFVQQGALSSYQTVRAQLSQAHRVIAYDRRFGGQSKSPLVVQTWDLVCQDVIELMDVLAIEKAHLGGGSFGAAIALGCAVRYPERVWAIAPSNIAGGVICEAYL